MHILVLNGKLRWADGDVDRIHTRKSSFLPLSARKCMLMPNRLG